MMRGEGHGRGRAGAHAVLENEVTIPAGRVELDGALSLPEDAVGIVVFAHGSGSGRHSPRNQFVAEQLQIAGLGTLLMDLLTESEEVLDARSGQLRFDIGFLASRIGDAISWLEERDDTRDLPVGLFGASTGGGAALVAAAQWPDRVGAVVSRGGRPDLAREALRRVQAPTLLIVGGLDGVVLDLNEHALSRMRALVKLEIVAGATHLFEEPGALDTVAQRARDWFLRYLPRHSD